MKEIQSFKRDHDLAEGAETEVAGAATPDFDDEIDLRAEDDALIAAELEAAESRQSEEPEPADESEETENGERPTPSRRRRGRRGTRRGGRAKGGGALEATFDHGEEGYGLWLDPAVQDDPVYAEYWAGHRPVEVVIEEDQIVIRRSAEPEGEGE